MSTMKNKSHNNKNMEVLQENVRIASDIPVADFGCNSLTMSILEDETGRKLVDYVRQRKGRKNRPKGLFGTPVGKERRKISFPFDIVKKSSPPPQQYENSNNLLENNTLRDLKLKEIRVPLKRLSQNLVRKVLLSEFEKISNDQFFLPPLASTPCIHKNSCQNEYTPQNISPVTDIQEKQNNQNINADLKKQNPFEQEYNLATSKKTIAVPLMDIRAVNNETINLNKFKKGNALPEIISVVNISEANKTTENTKNAVEQVVRIISDSTADRNLVESQTKSSFSRKEFTHRSGASVILTCRRNELEQNEKQSSAVKYHENSQTKNVLQQTHNVENLNIPEYPERKDSSQVSSAEGNYDEMEITNSSQPLNLMVKDFSPDYAPKCGNAMANKWCPLKKNSCSKNTINGKSMGDSLKQTYLELSRTLKIKTVTEKSLRSSSRRTLYTDQCDVENEINEEQKGATTAEATDNNLETSKGCSKSQMVQTDLNNARTSDLSNVGEMKNSDENIFKKPLSNVQHSKMKEKKNIREENGKYQKTTTPNAVQDKNSNISKKGTRKSENVVNHPPNDNNFSCNNISQHNATIITFNTHGFTKQNSIHTNDKISPIVPKQNSGKGRNKNYNKTQSNEYNPEALDNKEPQRRSTRTRRLPMAYWKLNAYDYAIVSETFNYQTNSRKPSKKRKETKLKTNHTKTLENHFDKDKEPSSSKRGNARKNTASEKLDNCEKETLPPTNLKKKRFTEEHVLKSNMNKKNKSELINNEKGNLDEKFSSNEEDYCYSISSDSTPVQLFDELKKAAELEKKTKKRKITASEDSFENGIPNGIQKNEVNSKRKKQIFTGDKNTNPTSENVNLLAQSSHSIQHKSTGVTKNLKSKTKHTVGTINHDEFSRPASIVKLNYDENNKICDKSNLESSDSGRPISDFESGKTVKKDKNIDFFLSRILEPKSTLTQERMHVKEILALSEARIATIDTLTFNEDSGVEYAHYPNSNYGYIKFHPKSIKKLAKSRVYELNFIVLHGTINVFVGDRCYTSQDGDLITVPKGTKYKFENPDEINSSILLVIKK